MSVGRDWRLTSGEGAVSFRRCGWGDVCGCAVGFIDIGVGCCTVAPVFFSQTVLVLGFSPVSGEPRLRRAPACSACVHRTAGWLRPPP